MNDVSRIYVLYSYFNEHVNPELMIEKTFFDLDEAMRYIKLKQMESMHFVSYVIKEYSCTNTFLQ